MSQKETMYELAREVERRVEAQEAKDI
jgi:hypothetical protein